MAVLFFGAQLGGLEVSGLGGGHGVSHGWLCFQCVFD